LFRDHRKRKYDRLYKNRSSSLPGSPAREGGEALHCPVRLLTYTAATFKQLQQEGEDMHFLREIVLAITALLLLVAVSGCDKEGPAERAGKKLDDLGK
jgi:hypothetical protein